MSGVWCAGPCAVLRLRSEALHASRPVSDTAATCRSCRSDVWRESAVHRKLPAIVVDASQSMWASWHNRWVLGSQARQPMRQAEESTCTYAGLVCWYSPMKCAGQQQLHNSEHASECLSTHYSEDMQAAAPPSLPRSQHSIPDTGTCIIRDQVQCLVWVATQPSAHTMVCRQSGEVQPHPRHHAGHDS